MRDFICRSNIAAFIFLIAFSGGSFAGPVSCRSVFGGIRIHVNVHSGLTEAQLSEMASAAHEAVNFSKKKFYLPNEISFNAGARNDALDFPHYDPVSDRIHAVYQFGRRENGRFLTGSRRHSRDIFYHEFGHLIFQHNAGKTEDLISFYKENYALKARDVMDLTYLPESVLKEYIQAYNELFADAFAVALSKNPRAMAYGDFVLHREQDLVGKFQAPPKQILRARDFLNKIDVESWNENEVHIAFAPARSAFSENPHAIYLLKNDPARLSKVAFDAINFELRRLFSEDIALLPSLTIPQLNRRLIEVMKMFLQKDQDQGPPR